MATDLAAEVAPAPAPTEVTADKPAIFSRLDAYTPPPSPQATAEAEAAARAVDADPVAMTQTKLHNIDLGDDTSQPETKEERTDAAGAPPSLIHSTPRHGAMVKKAAAPSAAKSLQAKAAAKSQGVTSPPVAISKKAEAAPAESSFWQTLCCFKPAQTVKAAAVAETRSNTGTDQTWSEETDGERPVRKLLPELLPQHAGRKCLVLDLDETLVHSSFKPTPNPDYIIPVEIEGQVYSVYVQKRPGVDEFMRTMAEIYEIVIYTASLSKYADPLLDLLDPEKTITHRLFREDCTQFRGAYVKDMGLINRSLGDSIIVDNSSLSFQFHPDNAIHCTSFFDDMGDRELDAIGEFLQEIAKVDDVRDYLCNWNQYLEDWCNAGGDV